MTIPIVYLLSIVVIIFYILWYRMTDQTPVTPPVETPTTPTPVDPAVAAAQQTLDAAKQSAQQVASQVTDTAKQIAADPTKVVWLVWDQLWNLSQAVGAKELLDDTTSRLMPMKDFVIHTVKIAFFMDSQKRVSRGEFLIWGLSSMIIMGIVSAVLPLILWAAGFFISSLLMLIPVINLGMRRFRDMNKPTRYAIMLIIPIFGWIVPALFMWNNTNNPHWPDPVLKAPADSQGYIIIVLSLFIVSSILITILWAIGVSVSNPTDSVSSSSTPEVTTNLPSNSNQWTTFNP